MLPVYYSRKNNQNWLPSIFNSLFDDDFVTPTKQFASPAINIVENEKNYEIELAAPGLSKDDFKLNVNNDDELEITLERKNEEEKKDKRNFLRREFSYASYRRSFVLPEEVEREKISAVMVDGVLRITLPKKEEIVKTPAQRQIEIK